MHQPEAFTTAVRAYVTAHQAGCRDARRLKALANRIDRAFVWEPREAPPLTPEQVARSEGTFKTLAPDIQDRLLEVFEELVTLPEDECSRTLDLWIAAMEVNQSC